jgi:hypothetical protein
MAVTVNACELPAAIENVAGETLSQLFREAAVTVPVRVPPPVFETVSVFEEEIPPGTRENISELEETVMAGWGAGGGGAGSIVRTTGTCS